MTTATKQTKPNFDKDNPDLLREELQAGIDAVLKNGAAALKAFVHPGYKDEGLKYHVLQLMIETVVHGQPEFDRRFSENWMVRCMFDYVLGNGICSGYDQGEVINCAIDTLKATAKQRNLDWEELVEMSRDLDSQGF